MNHKPLITILLVFLLIPSSLFSLTISIRSFDHPDFTRVVLEGDGNFEFKVKQGKQGLEVAIDQPATIEKSHKSLNNSILVDKIEHRSRQGKSVLDMQLKGEFKVKRNFVLERPYRVVFDLVKAPAPAPIRNRADIAPDAPKKDDDAQTTEPPKEQSKDNSKENTEAKPEAKPEDNPEDKPEDKPEDNPGEQDEPDAAPQEEEPQTDAAPSTPLKKRLAIETICIDPGHGGSDIGAVGKQGTEEKVITFKVAESLRKKIVSRLGLRVVMTRKKDTEVSLNSRVSIANNAKAQMFVSIHVNASYRKSARGPETFFVSLKATDQEALKLSQKENNSYEELGQITEDDELKMILWDMAQNEYIKDSSKLAEFIQNELNVLMHTRNRGVKQAPFRVLMRAAMPAVLVEIAFVSNPFEEKKLMDDAFLEQVSQSVFNGISKFIYYHNRLYQ